MPRFSTGIIVALLTFVMGVAATAIWLSARHESLQTQPPGAVDVTRASKQANDALVPSKPCSLSPGKKKISDMEAVRFGECFVIGNGYTDLPPMEDKNKLTYESWSDGPPAEEAMERRHDTIESKAYGVMKGGRVKDGWSVVFRYNLNNPRFTEFRPEFLEHLKGVGRRVTMDAYGGTLRVEHEDSELSRFKRIEEISR
jgi:hypothetical protein